MTEIRRDVALSVVVRIDRTGNWVEWSTGHRSVPEVLAVAETLASLPAVAEVRFDRITRTTERMGLHDLDSEEPAADLSPGGADRAAILREAADFVRGLLLTRTSITTAGLEAELRRMAAEASGPGFAAGEARLSETREACACGQDGCEYCDVEEEGEEPSEEQIVRGHVTTVHLIGEQLTAVESYLWGRLAEVRPAVASQPEAGEATAEHHMVDGALYLCHAGDHYCPAGAVQQADGAGEVDHA